MSDFNLFEFSKSINNAVSAIKDHPEVKGIQEGFNGLVNSEFVTKASAYRNEVIAKLQQKLNEIPEDQKQSIREAIEKLNGK